MPHHARAGVPHHGQALLPPPALVLPPRAVTGVGSLPFRDPHTAVRWVAQACPRLPCWPELPRCSPHTRSVEQTFGAFTDLVRPSRTGSGYEMVPGQCATLLERLEQAPARLEPGRSPGFFAFEHAMAAGQFAHAVAVKGRLLGPLTLAWQLAVEGRPLATQPVYRAAIGRYLGRSAHWQIDRLAQWGKPVLFFLDGPCLAWAPSPSEPTPEELVAVRRCPGVLLGVHTCARLVPGGVLTALGHVREGLPNREALLH